MGARGRSTVVAVAKWSAEHPWRAIIAWFLFVAVCLAVGSSVGTRSATSADFRVGEAGRAEAMAADGGLTVPAVEKILITAKGGGRIDRAESQAAATDLVARMRALPAVAKVGTPARSTDGNAVEVPVTMAGEQVAAKKHLPALLAATAAVQSAHPDLRVAETGDASIGKGTDDQRSSDLLRSETITLPVTLVILLIVFGAVLAAGVPLLLALSSIAAAIGLSALFSHLVPDAGVGAEVIILMGMAVGVDYSLFYVKREREERLRAGGRLGHTAAVELAAATSGRAIVVSGIGVMVSTACLFIANDVIFSSLAMAAIIVVLVAVISSLTVLPAMLAKLGPRIDRPRIPLLGRRLDREGPGRVWPALLRPATRHPMGTLVVGLVVTLGLAAPALMMTLNQPGKNTFSDAIPAVVTYHELVAKFPDQSAAHLVVVRDDAAHSADVRAALAALETRAQADPAFGGHTGGTIQTSPNGQVNILTLSIPFEATSAPAAHTLDLLRASLLPATVGHVDGARFAVSGDVARNVDYVHNQTSRTPLVVALVLLLTFVMMVAAFRSIVIGLLAVVLNLLSAAAAFGVLVVVFQYHWAEHLLDFTSYGFISARVPLFLFVILFGVSMDYQVFLVSRIREAAQRGLSTRDAVFEGITSSAGVVTSAAVVMVSVFVSFIFLHLLEVKQIGFGLAVAVLVDAFIVRVLILPSAMTLLGRAAWWPSRAAGRAAAAPVRPENRPPASLTRSTPY
jgi:RND superfamily putative drug exporter